MTTIEVCVQDVEGVRTATEEGADRVELCAELWCGGITPSMDVIEASLECAPPEGLRILVRENRDTFEISDEEALKQAEDIRAIRERFTGGVPIGFVVGGLRDGSFVPAWLDMWREAAGGSTLIFHSAFDEVENPIAALEELYDHGWNGVLTTGGSSGVADIGGFQALLEASDGRMDIVGSGGLRSNNIRGVLDSSGLREVHFRAPGADGASTDAQTVADTVEAVRR